MFGRPYSMARPIRDGERRRHHVLSDVAKSTFNGPAHDRARNTARDTCRDRALQTTSWKSKGRSASSTASGTRQFRPFAQHSGTASPRPTESWSSPAIPVHSPRWQLDIPAVTSSSTRSTRQLASRPALRSGRPTTPSLTHRQHTWAESPPANPDVLALNHQLLWHATGMI